MEPITNPGKRENLQAFGGSAIQDVPSEQRGEKASELFDQVKGKASDAMEAIKETSSQWGERLQEGGEYLRGQAAEGVEQVTGLIRRYPVPALLISFVAGFFVCRALKD